MFCNRYGVNKYLLRSHTRIHDFLTSTLPRQSGADESYPQDIARAYLTCDTPRGYHTGMEMDKKQKLLRRLSIIEGQFRGIKKMVEEERYCVDIITQTEAVKNALSGVENALLEKHLSTHVVEQMRKGQKTKAIAEILKIYKLAQYKR